MKQFSIFHIPFSIYLKILKFVISICQIQWQMVNGKWQMLARGQAMVTLLFFSVIAMTITTGAVMVMFSNSLGATRFQQGSVAYEVAQSGAENAILRLLRDPDYTGETLTVGNGTATITVTHTSGSSYTILSVGTVGNFVRKIQVDGTYSDHLFTESSRREVY